MSQFDIRPNAQQMEELKRRLDQTAEDFIRGARSGRAHLVQPKVEALLVQFPGHLGLRQALVEIKTVQQDFKGAADEAERMVRNAPNQPMAQVLLGFCLMRIYERDKALTHLRKAAELAHNDVKALSIVSHYLQKTEATDESLRVLLRLDELQPNNAHILQGIAAAYRFLGELDKAEEFCNRSIAHQPLDGHAYWVRSDLRKQTPERNHTNELEKMLKTGVENPRARIHIQFALAKEYEDLGDADASFRNLKEASDFQRKQMEYDVSSDLQTMEEIKQNFDAAYFKRAPAGFPAPDPIFVIGMPRTGTTLIERILGSHSKVHSRGELVIFPRLMVRAVRELVGSPNVAPADRVKLTAQINYKALGEQYIAAASKYPHGETRFIDKLPYNFLNVGPIHAALPNAKIVQLERHPMDTCYAVYKMLFGNAYPFSYSLEELAAYYVGYRRLIDHWHAVLPPGRILKVRYEDVVADQEGQSRRLFEHCGLPWEDQVKEFYKNTQASTTASAAQVRQPIYKSSVAKWKQFERHLEPLRKILAKSGISDLD
jgi:tetratricopeptide (TPR) repeat protein